MVGKVGGEIPELNSGTAIKTFQLEFDREQNFSVEVKFVILERIPIAKAAFWIITDTEERKHG